MMKFRRDLIVLVLSILCLAATFLMVTPTRSNSASTASNQWADINDDGKVDIYDAIILAGNYGQSTDPMKNVVVNDGTLVWSSGNVSVAPNSGWWSPIVDTTNYTQMTLRARTNGSINVWLHTFIGDSDIREFVNQSWQYADGWYTTGYKINFASIQVQIGNLDQFNASSTELLIYMSAIPVVDIPNTQNVAVTNWPQDRQSTLAFRTQRIVILESFSDGLNIAPSNIIYGAYFTFDFTPVGQLVNVTYFWIGWVAKAPDNNMYLFNWTINYNYNYLEGIVNSVNPQAGWNLHGLTYGTEIQSGVNYLQMWRGYPTGTISLYRLEITIGYYSYA